MSNKVYTAEDFMPQQDLVDVPGTAQRQDILDPETEEAKGLWQETKAIAMETLPGLGTGIATSPWLLAGPKGWIGYGLLNFATGLGTNTIAQKMRNPEKDTSFKEATLNGIFTAVPGLYPLRTAKLGKKGLMGVRAAEGGIMAGGEEFGRQLIAVSEGEREALSPFEIGFSTVIGSGLGAGMGRYEHGMFNRAGVSTQQAQKIQTQMEAHVADRINTIDGLLKKNPELADGEMGRTLQKERETLAEQLTEVSRTDRKYLEGLRDRAQAKKEEQEKQWAEIVKEFQEEKPEGFETVLRPKGEVPTTAKPEAPTFNFKQAEVAEDARISRGNLPELNQLDDLRKHIGIEGDVKSMDDISKLMQDPANKDKLLKFLQDNPIEVSHNRALKEQTGESFYEITDGNHRYELAKMAGIDDMPVSAKSAKEIGIEAPAAKAAEVETTIAPQPPQPTKLTTEQKLQALERMKMSDEDLLDYLEGKTDLLPINIGAFTDQQDVQRSMAAVLEQVKEGFKKRGPKTDRESLIKRSAELRKQLNPDIDPLKYTKEIAKKSEDMIFESVVADSMTLNAFKQFNKKLSGDFDFNDPAVIHDIMADFDRLGEFAEASGSIGSNAGKLLQSRKVSRDQLAAVVSQMEKDAITAEQKLTKKFVKYSKDLSPEELQKQLQDLGGLKALRGLTTELRVLRDTGKLGRMLELRRRGVAGKVAAMTTEVLYSNILSGPVTQAAAFTGNTFMGIYSLSNQALGALVGGDLKTSKHAVMTARNLLHALPDAWEAAKVAAKNSKGQMALDSHFEKVGGKAFSMEETGLSGAIGEGVENLGELMAYGPKGLVFQDEFYRHLFAKSQVKSLLSQEYKDLVAKGEAPVEGMTDYIEGKMSRYFVDGKRYKTQNDVQMEAVRHAQEQGLDGDEAVDFIKNYTKENWNTKLSSEMEYLRQFGDRITFQSDLKKGYGPFESLGVGVQELRTEGGATGFMAQYLVPFIKTPVNIFKEFGGTTSQFAELPGIGRLWARSREELMSDNPMIKANARGRQIVGAGLWASALYLADQQIITNSGPRDYKELENKKATGWMPNAINTSALSRYWETGDSGGEQLGDNYISLQRADPAATITALSGDLMRAREDNDFSDDELTYLMQTTAFALSRAVGQKSYLETVGGFLDALVSGRVAAEDDYGSAVLEDVTRRAVPFGSALNTLGRTDDPYIREVNGPLETLLNRLPGFVQTLDPARDAFGQRKPSYGGGLMRREVNAINPFTMSKSRGDRSVEAILKYRSGYAFPDPKRTIPGLDLRDIKVEGSNQSLYDRWKQIYSESDVKQAVIEEYDNPDLSKITVPRAGNSLPEVQKEAISKVFEEYRNAAFGQLLEEYPMLQKQYEYNVELQTLQFEGKDLPKETVAPELQELVK